MGESWSYTKKGLIIGLSYGLLSAIISFMGISLCNWNIAEASVVPNGVCSSPLIFFYLSFWLLDVLAIVLSLAMDGFFGVDFLYSFFRILFLIVSVFVFSGIGALFGWIFGKFREWMEKR